MWSMNSHLEKPWGDDRRRAARYLISPSTSQDRRDSSGTLQRSLLRPSFWSFLLSGTSIEADRADRKWLPTLCREPFVLAAGSYEIFPILANDLEFTFCYRGRNTVVPTKGPDGMFDPRGRLWLNSFLLVLLKNSSIYINAKDATSIDVVDMKTPHARHV